MVCGPPAAGKTTRAGEIAARSGGEVIDFDAIARQMGSPDEHDHPESVKAAVEAEFWRRVASAGPGDVVVRCAPTRAERDHLVQVLGGAEVVLLDVGAEEAKRRAVAADRPDWTAAAIDKWWGRFEPPEGDDMSKDVEKVDAVEAPAEAEAVEGGTPEVEAVEEDPVVEVSPADEPVGDGEGDEPSDSPDLAARVDALEADLNKAREERDEARASATRDATAAALEAVISALAPHYTADELAECVSETNIDALLGESGNVDVSRLLRRAQRAAGNTTRASGADPGQGTGGGAPPRSGLQAGREAYLATRK